MLVIRLGRVYCVHKNSSKYLVKEYVFSIAFFRRKVFENAIRTDPVFQAELRPELLANWQD
jgi:hypothetical protein